MKSERLVWIIQEVDYIETAVRRERQGTSHAPTISDFNDALKDNGTLDTPTWRQIQRLGDIRNLCSHSKEREPTKDEVSELIAGVEKFTKTLF